MEECAKRGYTGIDLHYNVLLNNPETIANAHKLGLEVNSYTVNDEDIVRRLIEMGIDAITTDIPERVQEIIVEMSPYN